MSFILSCPRCKAEPDDARLEVSSGTFVATKMYLQEDGFATMDAKSFDTDEERVYCHVCGETFSLGECLDDEMNERAEHECETRQTGAAVKLMLPPAAEQYEYAIKVSDAIKRGEELPPRLPAPAHAVRWENDLVQFARLLSEIVAAMDEGPMKHLIRDCATSMDLTTDQVNTLFDRADVVWEQAKTQLLKDLI